MKKLIYIGCSSLVFSLLIMDLWAQSSNSTSENSNNETNLNQKLLENAALSRKNLGDQAPKPVPTTIKILNNKGSSAESISKNSKTNLTDQEKQLSENFVNQAGANKIIKEKCVGEMENACLGMEVDHKVMGMNPGIIKMASQAYASFGALSDGFLPLTAGDGKTLWDNKKEEAKTEEPKTKPNEKDKKTDDKKKDEKTSDYCKYIPSATEALAAFTQQQVTQSLAVPVGGETLQKEQLLKAARAHESKAEQAQIQAVGWFGGAACYAANAALGNFAIDKNLMIKVGAATFLGAVYQSEVANNKDYADKTRAVANALPSKGDCNPVTENECYCSTPEYENDPNFCKVQIARRNAAAAAFTRVACTDNMLKIDPSCNCDKNNSCFDKVLENAGSGSIQLGMGYGNSPFKTIASLAKGRLEGGAMNSNAYAGTAAIAKKALKDFASKIPSNNSSLNSNQKEIYDALLSQGIPNNVARLMASNPPPKNAIDHEMAKANQLNLGAQTANSSEMLIKNSVLEFSGGNGLGVTGKKQDKKSNVDDILLKLNPGKAGPQPNAKIFEFAKKAEAQASQITKTDRPLFEIISHRYQSSAPKRLGLETNN